MSWLSDDRVALRPLAPEDAPALLAACSDPDVAGMLLPLPESLDDARRYVVESEEARTRGTSAAFAIVPSGGGELVGTLILMRPEPEVAEVAYWVRPDARGHGVATSALRLAAGWALDEFDLERLWLETDPENAASQRVAERAGFRREGVLRSHCRSLGGARHDCVIYSLLPGDPR